MPFLIFIDMAVRFKAELFMQADAAQIFSSNLLQDNLIAFLRCKFYQKTHGFVTISFSPIWCENFDSQRCNAFASFIDGNGTDNRRILLDGKHFKITIFIGKSVPVMDHRNDIVFAFARQIICLENFRI